MQNINVTVITGNLTRDPELRHTGGGTAICELRVAVNGRRQNDKQEWVDKPNFFDVVVWDKRGEACAKCLAKGQPVAVEGRLDWREWEAKDGSGKRQAVQIVANTVQFLGTNGNGGKKAEEENEQEIADRLPTKVEDLKQEEKEEDIPF